MTNTTQRQSGFIADHVSVTNGPRTVVSNFDLELQPGTWTNIVGSSSGDTSRLLAALSGRHPRAAGILVLDGDPLPEAPAPSLVGYVSRTHKLVTTLTAAETLMAALLVGGRHPAVTSMRRAEKQLQALDLPAAVWHNLVEQLSGGQQQRVALAQALVSRPRLLVLDDPTSELDPDTTQLVAKLLSQAVARGSCCITATRDETFAASASSTITV